MPEKLKLTLREIDAMIAEKVMGRTIQPGLNVPAYTVVIGTAWTVVEKMGSSDFRELAVIVRRAERDWEWHCVIGIVGEIGHEPLSHRSAPTAPLAICLAALQALGFDVEVRE